MFTVYILESVKTGWEYVGHAKDELARLKRHNKGYVHSTKKDRPWKVVYTEIFTTKQEAYRREMQIKSYKGGNEFKKLFTNTRADTEAVKRG